MVKAIRIDSSMVATYDKNGAEVTLRRLGPPQGIGRPSVRGRPADYPDGEENVCHQSHHTAADQPRQLLSGQYHKPPLHRSHLPHYQPPPPSSYYRERADEWADEPLTVSRREAIPHAGLCRYGTRGDVEYVTRAGVSCPAAPSFRAAYAPPSRVAPEAYQRARRHYRSTFYRSSVEGDHRIAAGGIGHGLGPAPRLVRSSRPTTYGGPRVNMPLQTVAPNQQVMDRPTVLFGASPVPRSAASLESPPMKVLKSPVTLCFAKMLGAASYLANHPTPDMVKKQLARTQTTTSGSSTTSCENDASVDHSDIRKTLLKRKLGESNDWTVEDQEVLWHKSTTESPPKRLRGLKPMTISEKEARALQDLGDSNPFVRLMNDEDLYHQVILQMTLETQPKDMKAPEVEAPTAIVEGFFWRDYPALEAILHTHMKAYYEMSAANRQSRYQQDFNNQLVSSIRAAARDGGYTFDAAICDKRLRDRIRCFYKTHLQNSKKRLATLQKHPTSVLHQSQLCRWMARVERRCRP